MHDRKIQKKLLKILILIVCLLLLLRVISVTIAKYESIIEANPDIQTAFYVLKKDFQTMNIDLGRIYPSDIPFIYNFSIANNNGNMCCETDLEYELKIRTTTNLPLTYELYKNQTYQTNGAINIIKNNTDIQDEHGTYFKIIETDLEKFSYIKNEKNNYQLVVRFDKKYKNLKYQDIIELIEITIDSRQII